MEPAFSIAFRLFAAAATAALLVGGPASASDRPLVAVVDGGVARTAELEGVLVGEYDFGAVPERPAFSPDHDHGTLVATVLHRAAEGAVDILSLRIDDPAGCPEGVNPPCQSDPLTIAAAIRAAVDLGADVINLSLAMPDNPAIVSAVQHAAANGIKVVLAAGNDGAERPGNRKAAIAGYPNAVLVGALDWTGGAWAGTNRPDENAGAAYRYVWRPGVAVDSVRADGTSSRASGTSIAAPIEAAFIASGKPARPMAGPVLADWVKEGAEAAPAPSPNSITAASAAPPKPTGASSVPDLASAIALVLAFALGWLASAIGRPDRMQALR